MPGAGAGREDRSFEVEGMRGGRRGGLQQGGAKQWEAQRRKQ